MPHTKAPPHIPKGYIASLTDAEHSEFRRMFASTSAADRDEIFNGDAEEWEAFSELHWQLVNYDEAEEERALSRRAQVELHVRRRCRPLSAIFETDEECKRKSVLSTLPAMDSQAEEVASTVGPDAPVVPDTPAAIKSPTPHTLASHPPAKTVQWADEYVSVSDPASHPADDDDVPSIPASNGESFDTSPLSVRKMVQGRLNRFMARAKSHVKRSKR